METAWIWRSLHPGVSLGRCLAVVLVFQGMLEACPDGAGLALADVANGRARQPGDPRGLKIG